MVPGLPTAVSATVHQGLGLELEKGHPRTRLIIISVALSSIHTANVYTGKAVVYNKQLIHTYKPRSIVGRCPMKYADGKYF